MKKKRVAIALVVVFGALGLIGGVLFLHNKSLSCRLLKWRCLSTDIANLRSRLTPDVRECILQKLGRQEALRVAEEIRATGRIDSPTWVRIASCFETAGAPTATPTGFPPTAVPAGSNRYGVSQGAHRDATLMPRSFELAAQAGIGWVRFGIWYGLVSPSPGIYRYAEARFDAQVRKARQEGLRILGTLAFATQWNTAAPANLPPQADPTHFPPRDYQAWADYVFKTVSRYKDDIEYWEVWNEPDLQSFWGGTPAQYAQLLAVTHDAIKRANPTKVVLGGLAFGGKRVNPNFLTEILSDARYPAARYFDVMNFHHYGSREDTRRKMEYVRNALAQVGASDKPIWITETGYSSDPSLQNDRNYKGPEGQAQWLRDMLPYLLNNLRADKVFWYRLYDYPADFRPDDHFRYHGLIDNQGNPKPSYFAYKELINSRASTAPFHLSVSVPAKSTQMPGLSTIMTIQSLAYMLSFAHNKTLDTYE